MTKTPAEMSLCGRHFQGRSLARAEYVKPLLDLPQLLFRTQAVIGRKNGDEE